MGWFDEQIEYRKKREREMLSDSYDKLTYTLTGRKSGAGFKEGEDVSDALQTLLKYFGIRGKEIPAKLKDLDAQLDYLLTASGIMYRRVTLEEGWHEDAMGVMITTLRESGRVITVLRDSMGRYVYTDPMTGVRVRINAAEEKKIGDEAYCFYKPLPLRKITLRDLFDYMKNSLDLWDLVSFGIAALMIVSKIANQSPFSRPSAVSCLR